MPPQGLGLEGAYGADAFSQEFVQMLARQNAQRIAQQQLAEQAKRADFQQRIQEQDLNFRLTEAERKAAADKLKEDQTLKTERDFEDTINSSDFTPQQKTIIRLARKTPGGAVPWEVLAPKPPAAGSTFDQLLGTQKILIAKKYGVAPEQLTPEQLAEAQDAAVRHSTPAVPSQGSEFDQAHRIQLMPPGPEKAAAQAALDRTIKEMHPVDPEVEANRQLMNEYMTERNRAEKEKNAPVDVSNNLQQSRLAGGFQYVNMDNFEKAQHERVRKSAAAAGAIALSKDQAESLDAAEYALSNAKAILAQVEGLLPKDAAGRPMGAAGNTLNQILQNNNALGAFESWREAAIPSVQAVALKGMGLRLNAGEIASAQLMLPKITDTIGTARQRVKNFETMLENKVRATIPMPHAAAAGAQGSAAKPPAGVPPIEQRVIGKTQAIIGGVLRTWQAMPGGGAGWQ
jgi:hypothetical protein